MVIYVRVVRKLREYTQESGRAGRDGLESEAIILRGVSYDRSGNVREGDSRGDVEDEMWEFMATEGCRRVVLDRVMDGRGDRAIDGRGDRVSCERGEEMCDRCRAREAEFRREEVKGVIKREVGLVEEEEKREEDNKEEFKRVEFK